MARRSRPVADASLAVVYIRVSTDDQALGPDAQRAAVARWAKANHVTVVAEHGDLGVSGGAEIAERPALMAALAELEQRGAGVLLVAKRDRLARDVVVAAAVERLTQSKGARIVSADGTSTADGPEGMLMRGLVDLFAQYERALIRSRTRAALQVKKQRGERIGQVPLGFRAENGNKSLEVDESEQRVLARIRQLRAAGWSVRAIADALNSDGIPARGKCWHSTTIARVLRNAS